jgi:glycosyltransferase involved in cell wall biosynthesis
MRILFDCTNITVGGGIQVANSFLRYAFRSTEIEYCFLLSNKVFESLNEKEKSDRNLKINVVTSNHYTLLPGHISMRRIRTIEAQFKPDVTFTLFGPAYWKSKAPHIVGFARPHYILHHSPFYRIRKNRKLIRFMYFLEAVHNYLFRKNSDYLFVENESMVSALQKKYRKKVYYVPNTYNQVFDNYVPVAEKKSDSVFRLLTISSDYPHKNLESIPRVATVLKQKYPDFRFRFIVTIKDDDENVSTENINYIGSVTIEQCPDFYLNSDAMYLPTLLECFSASYVEAMYMKVPILTSDLDFARSICGEAARYFDPLNEENIADTIYNLAHKVTDQKQLIDFGSERLNIFGSPEDRYNRFVSLFLKIK